MTHTRGGSRVKRAALKTLMRSIMWHADALMHVSEDICASIVADADSSKRMAEPLDDEWFTMRSAMSSVATAASKVVARGRDGRALAAPTPVEGLRAAVRPFEQGTLIRTHFELLGVLK